MQSYAFERSIRAAITTPDSSKQCLHRSSIRMSACWVLYYFLKPQRNGDNSCIPSIDCIAIFQRFYIHMEVHLWGDNFLLQSSMTFCVLV